MVVGSSPVAVQKYGSSEHTISISKKLKEIYEEPYLYLRASNLMNMTIHDFYEAKLNPEIKDTYRFYSVKYKTSLVYGEKVIIIS